MKGTQRNKRDGGRKINAGSKYLSIFGFFFMVYAFVYFVMESKDSTEKEKAVVTTVQHEPVTTVISEEVAVAFAMQEGIESLAPAELAVSVGEQERIDAIVKAFQRLPGQELDRFNVDFEQAVVAGTPQAEHLLEAWKARQVELKEAMKNILQPAEHMTNITRMLNGTAPELTTVFVTGSDGTAEVTEESAEPKQLTVDDKLYLLMQLESLLDDVDNARDFHTIGAWPTLLSFLHPHQHVQLRTAAAWAVGTAVKNTYDYQLWTLERSPVVAGSAVEESKSAVQLLVDMLAPQSAAEGAVENAQHADLQKRALYALSSAMRGNLDVQDSTMQLLRGHLQSAYVNNMLVLAGQYSSSPPELQRKVWASVSDLIEERAYIRRELSEEATALLNSKSSDSNNSNNSSNTGADAATAAAVEAVQDTILLGDFLLAEHWLSVAADAALHYSTVLAAAPATGSLSSESNKDSASSNSVDHHVSVHASLRSIMTYFKEVLQDKPHIYSTQSASGWQGRLLNTVRTVRESERFGVAQYETLRESAEAMAVLLGLLDQGANGAVF